MSSSQVAVLVAVLSLLWSAYQHFSQRPRLRLRFEWKVLVGAGGGEVLMLRVENWGRSTAYLYDVQLLADLEFAGRLPSRPRPVGWLLAKALRLAHRVHLLRTHGKSRLIPGLMHVFGGSHVPSLISPLAVPPGGQCLLVFDEAALMKSASPPITYVYCAINSLSAWRPTRRVRVAAQSAVVAANLVPGCGSNSAAHIGPYVGS